jgi:membrane protein implicated in regulation of membrane protease activity
MALHWIWWTLALVAVGAEFITGTFYLLAVGIALAAGGFAAYAGIGLEMQFVIAALLGVVLTGIAHRARVRRGTPPLQPGLDIGQPVKVQQWKPDGGARVAYRGTLWDAELAGPDVRRDETLYIVATRGSLLVLGNERPA